MRTIRIPAYAKVNLRLEVLGKRADGYHELRTIFQTVGLHDTLEFRSSRRPGISLQIQGNEILAKEEIESRIAARNAARKDKNFAESDRIRDELAALGVVLKDSKDGTTWEVAR